MLRSEQAIYSSSNVYLILDHTNFPPTAIDVIVWPSLVLESSLDSLVAATYDDALY